MEVRVVENKNDWENFVLSQMNTLFVQSFHYGEFYESMSEQSWIFGVYEDYKLIGGSLVISTHAKRGDFLYLPYGPIGEVNKFLDIFINYLKSFAEKNKYDFIRISPFLDETEDNKNLFKKLGFRPAPMHVLAETTWILDLDKTEEQLLTDMNKNHRNLIHRCEKENVKIEIKNQVADLENFNKLHDETAKRHNFHRFSQKYITNEFSVFSQHNEALVLNAYLPDGRLDSSAIVMFYGNMSAYRHGASLSLDKRLPTSYLLQWEAIKEAKKRNIKYYNFWGIAPENSPKNHPFHGITHFKKGFGGSQKDLLHCQDLPITSKYWLNWLVESIRKIKRGF
ncbi:MAG: peptidoglycan bridge formation glycyltransferase FemA/FemB family protein [Candidatus Magasanikiibacteriota bacterium]